MKLFRPRKVLTMLTMAFSLLMVWVPQAHSVFLDDLFNGGSIIVDDKLFDDWVLISDESDFPVDPSSIEITGLTGQPLDPGLKFTAHNNALTADYDGPGPGEDEVDDDGTAILDFLFGFRTVVLDPAFAIKDVSLALTAFDEGDDVDVIGMSDTVSDALLAELGTLNVHFAATIAEIEFGPQSEIYHQVRARALSAGRPARIEMFEIRVSQERVPVPATLALLGVGLAGIGYARRKQITAA